MENIENRNYVRLSNQFKILEILRHEKTTITNLAEQLDISFTAASHIVDEMIEEKIIKYSSKKAIKNRGRTPSFVELNIDAGVVCCVDMSKRDLEVFIASLDLKTIASRVIPNVMFISKEHLFQIEDLIKEMLSLNELKNMKLLSICIASPGMIRSDSFEYASVYRVKNFEKLNPVVFFSNAFNVKVEMYNDIRISSLAELKCGAFPKVPFNGLFVHIGSSSGISIIFNGLIYKGSNNFSGELPQYCREDEEELVKENYFNTKLFPLWEIEDKIRLLKGLPKLDPDQPIDFNQLRKDIADGDKITLDVIDESCKRNAFTLIALATILDLEYIVIEGPILSLGEEYVTRIKKYVDRYSFSEIRAKILSSQLENNSSHIGVAYEAVSIYLLNRLEKMTQKRLNQPSFTINKVFRDI